MYLFLTTHVVATFALASLVHAAFTGDPPDAHHPWAVHDANRPQPAVVEPAAQVGGAPSDAIVLFDGTEASFRANWQHVKPQGKRKADWTVQDGYMLVQRGAGYIETQAEFGDCQLHVEWSHERQLDGDGQKRGNSGVFLPGGIEVQILDNYDNPSYPDGSAGAVYGVMPPAANALRAPGQWQSYDIIYRRPIVREGVVLDEGSLTVLVNGVVVQDSTPLDGGGGFRKRKPLTQVYPEKGRLKFQDHGNPVRFRNIWYRELRPRPVDGGTDGRLSASATQAKRAEIGAQIRARAAEQAGFEQMMTLLEASIYAQTPSEWAACDALLTDYVATLEGLTPNQLKQQRSSALALHKALEYLQQHDLLAPESAPAATLRRIAVEQEWVKSK